MYVEELCAKQAKTTQIEIENKVDVSEDNKGPHIEDIVGLFVPLFH